VLFWQKAVSLATGSEPCIITANMMVTAGIKARPSRGSSMLESNCMRLASHAEQ
jgi:hypothetical protein